MGVSKEIPMTCPSCLIALAGFGDAAAAQAPTQTLPTEVGAEVLGSLALSLIHI